MAADPDIVSGLIAEAWRNGWQSRQICQKLGINEADLLAWYRGTLAPAHIGMELYKLPSVKPYSVSRERLRYRQLYSTSLSRLIRRAMIHLQISRHAIASALNLTEGEISAVANGQGSLMVAAKIEAHLIRVLETAKLRPRWTPAPATPPAPAPIPTIVVVTPPEPRAKAARPTPVPEPLLSAMSDWDDCPHCEGSGSCAEYARADWRWDSGQVTPDEMPFGYYDSLTCRHCRGTGSLFPLISRSGLIKETTDSWEIPPTLFLEERPNDDQEACSNLG